MAISTENVRRRTAFDADATAAKPLQREEDTRLPLVYLGRAVSALDHSERPPAPLTPDQARHKQFFRSIQALAGPEAQRMMDYLEWRVDGNTEPDNQRFGTRGMELLSQLTPQSDHWGHIQKPMTPEHKQMIIDAAKYALTQNFPGGELWDVHGGDGIFEPLDMTNWLARNPQQDGLIGPFKQGKENDCGLLAGIEAVARTPHGQRIIQEAITRNADGSWQVELIGADMWNGQTSFRVTQEMLDTRSNATGDLDVRILEEAFRERYRADPGVEVPDIRGITGGTAMSILTGETAESQYLTYDADIAKVVEAKSKGAAMTFATERVSIDWNARGLIDGHVFTIESFDWTKQLVYFRNPWDISKLESMPIDNLRDTKVHWAFIDGVPS